MANLKVDESLAEIEAATCIDFMNVDSEDISSLSHSRTILIKDIDDEGFVIIQLTM